MSNSHDESSTPDLAAVHADDALLDALGGSDRKVADELGSAELNSLLLAWSREVDSEPMPELVDAETALATIRAARESHRNDKARRRRMLIPVAAAAAVLGVTFGGASIAARDAQPGDTLWGLTQVLYADKAASVEASYDVRAEFKRAREALDDGDLNVARDALEKARKSLQNVAEEDDHDGLQREHDKLRDELDRGGSAPDDKPTTPEGDDPPSSNPSSPGGSSDQPSEQPPSEPSSEPSEPSTEPSTPSAPPSSAESDQDHYSSQPRTNGAESATEPRGEDGG
ncbi:MULTISPECIES: anti-sigma-D factor RsdA [Thermocrispum]|uniref:anti-sigma-D factor RsdA n=1 Tax=Thermocrispum TaxID=37924 RepID=UPI00041F5323|nr:MULTISPECIES: anti-sigma-D factor RsdA [Thermocrispum]